MNENLPVFCIVFLLLTIACAAGSGPPPAAEAGNSKNGSAAAVCEVHGILLLEEVAAPAPLTVEFEPEFEEAMRTLFPNLGLAYAIDCPGLDSVIIQYCPECRAANRMWIEEH